jgi:PAS domain-containing protein
VSSSDLALSGAYDPQLVVASIAIVVSTVSLRLASLFRDEARGRIWREVGSVLLMGAAICAMHYTGMATASFTRTLSIPDLSHAVTISYLGTVSLAAASLTILALTVATCGVDKLQEQKALLDELFEQAPQAVALTNGDGRVVRVNAEFTRTFGIRRRRPRAGGSPS